MIQAVQLGILEANASPSWTDRRAAQYAKSHARVSDLRDSGRLDRLNLLEPGLGVAQVVEQPCAASENHGDDRDEDLVQQTRRQILLRGARTAADRHILVAGRCPGLLECRLDSIRDEVKGGSALHLQRLARVVGENEDRVVEGRVVSPPALPGVVAPRSRPATEHVSAHDGRAHVAENLLGDRRARVDLAAFLTVALAECPERNHPLVKLLSSDPEWILLALLGTGDVAVERYRDVHLELAHRMLLPGKT